MNDRNTPLPPTMEKWRTPRVGIVSLGCPKALVDSERILTSLRAEGYEFTESYDDADLVLVNTCGFLDSARDESLAAIGEAIAENGRVVVTGCLGKHEDLIRGAHPKVLAVTGPQDYEGVLTAVHDALPPAHDPFRDLVPPQGLRLTPRHYAYLKVSEGCNHRCSFCIIPSMRGDLKSRPVDDVLREAESLVEAGVRELLVVSQDTSAYGLDLKYRASPWKDGVARTHMTDLAKHLGAFGVWVRLHYIYPYPHVDEVIPLMADGLILPYLDIPFQHASPAILKAMKRPGNREKVLDRIRAWRNICPELAIRSTFIVGFPGETEDDFQLLLDWLTEAGLDRVGCFKFEPVRGADANDLPGAVDDATKDNRRNRLMNHQRAIGAAKMREKMGQTIEVIIDEVDAEGAIGRSHMDAPEIDGQVFLDDETDVQPGDMVMVEIDDASEYDLWGNLAQ